jgi:hypothetical protein
LCWSRQGPIVEADRRLTEFRQPLVSNQASLRAGELIGKSSDYLLIPCLANDVPGFLDGFVVTAKYARSRLLRRRPFSIDVFLFLGNR